MDVYLTNSNFVQQAVIDDFESFIWTERYAEMGEFEMLVPWRADLASNLRANKYLTMSETDRVMIIENAFLDRPSSNPKANMVKVSGRSLEAIFTLRDNRSLNVLGDVKRTSTRGAAAAYLVDTWCISNGAANNNFPGLSLGSTPAGTTEELSIARGVIYDGIKSVLDADKLGFRLTKRKVNNVYQAGQIVFTVYRGIDRTDGTLPSNIGLFSPDLDNLTDISVFESIAGYYNEARVIGAKASSTVTTPGVTSPAGYSRRTLVVMEPDVGADSTTTVGEDQVVLAQKGREALASQENAFQTLVDGEVPPNDPSFRVAGLGDTVWVRDFNGNQTKKRISEKIWTSDKTGDKRLPTFEAV